MLKNKLKQTKKQKFMETQHGPARTSVTPFQE